MFTVLRRREFTSLWCANLLSTLSDWMLFAALPFPSYQRTGAAVATGAMFIAKPCYAYCSAR
ncbi:MAG TPA: hypothetical protein VFS21_09575 [Roseiflexaceae bacterium]|nr:hypothetical protein [Roseiflexaceae bacterium]